MVDALIRRLSPQKLGGNADYHETKNSRLLISYLLVVAGAVLFFIVFDALGGKSISATLNLVFWLFLASLALLYRVTGAYAPTVFLLVSSCQLLLGVQHVFAPDGLHANLFWPPLLTMMSVHLLGRGSGIKLGLASSLIVIVAAILRPVIGARGDAFAPDEIFRFHIISLALTVIVGLYIAGRLTSEMDQMLRRIESQKEKFFDLYETNSALLSVLGHDINNHLTSLNLQLSTLQRSLPRETHADLEKVEQRVARIATIVKQTSDLNAIRSGKLSIQPVPVELDKALDESLELLASELGRKEIVVTRRLPADGEPPVAMAEPYSLVANVLSNVLSNAIKFSPDASEIDLSIEEDGDAWLLHVRDHGIGIPSNLLPHVFDFRVPTNRPGLGGEKGTGFGMPITKMFMDRYGGSVEVSSGPSGTNVTLGFRRA